MCSKTIYFGIILLLGMLGFVKGSCLEYGHSCWGAHGKRSTGKIYRSIDGSEGQQSEEIKRKLQLTQDQVKPSELLNMLLERNDRMNSDDTIKDFNHRKNIENSQMFDVSQQQLQRNLRDAFRKGRVFLYSPSEAEDKIVQKIQEPSTKLRRHLEPEAIEATNEDNQVDNYQLLNPDMEYLDLK